MDKYRKININVRREYHIVFLIYIYRLQGDVEVGLRVCWDSVAEVHDTQCDGSPVARSPWYCCCVRILKHRSQLLIRTKHAHIEIEIGVQLIQVERAQELESHLVQHLHRSWSSVPLTRWLHALS